MKILKIMLIALVVIVALFCIVAALAPASFTVERKISIKAPADVVFGEINSFQKWESWSPWLSKDSTITNVYSGPEQGVGNKTSWTSKKSGSGSMEITESVPGKAMHTKVALGDFNLQAHFTLNEMNGATEITWADSGSSGFPWKIFNLFADKMMGPDFESGLAKLKKHVEELPQWKLGEYKIEEAESMAILCVMDSCPIAEIGKKLGSLYGEIGAVLQKNTANVVDMNQAGPVMAYYYSNTPEKVVLEAAVPVKLKPNKEIKKDGRVSSRITGKVKTLSVPFFGDYQYLGKAVAEVATYMKSKQLEINGPECEKYVTDPGSVKNKMEIETIISFPVK